jgi:hypothetical protein
LINIAPHEAHQAFRQRADEGLPAFDLKDPVEKIRFDNAIYSCLCKLVATEEACGAKRLNLKAKDGMRNDLGCVNQQCMVYEKVVIILKLCAQSR